MTALTPDDIDAILPQTQCGLCGYGGCMPYAEALIFENAAINLCPPGGVKTLHKLSELLQKDPTPFIAEMNEKSKPPMTAVIRESECIGCTKCIQACPVDAILGSAKLMHSVITTECTGCELCVAPCPVDCIDIVSLEQQEDKSKQYRDRFNARTLRLEKEEKAKKSQRISTHATEKKQYIMDALARIKAKKK